MSTRLSRATAKTFIVGCEAISIRAERKGMVFIQVPKMDQSPPVVTDDVHVVVGELGPHRHGRVRTMRTEDFTGFANSDRQILSMLLQKCGKSEQVITISPCAEIRTGRVCRP
jgi:hypothetical protein